MSLALRKALSTNNVKKGFSATGIFPLNAKVVDSQLLPSEVFRSSDGEAHESGEEEATTAVETSTAAREGGEQENVPEDAATKVVEAEAEVQDAGAE